MRKSDALKGNLHPRNRHRDRYDFPRLVAASPELKKYVAKNKYGDESIDFANPEAVKALNLALLREFYGVTYWDIPEGYLCPPIPGRADHLHSASDLLADLNSGKVPTGRKIRVLDIGVGANAIYPIIGQHEYGWSFVGADVDAEAVASAKRIVEKNPSLAPAVEIRLQSNAKQIFQGVIRPEEKFDLVVCNPPFHASLAEAQEGTTRKWRNLGKTSRPDAKNFGGRGNELWYPGGEISFIDRMIEESIAYAKNVLWFTTLVSKESNLPEIEASLDRAGVASAEIIEMSQGQKKSRLVAWTFLAKAQREAWAKKSWV